MLSQTKTPVASEYTFFSNTHPPANHIQNNVIGLFKKQHYFFISGIGRNPAVEINLHYNALSPQGIRAVETALNEVYERFIDKFLVIQKIRNLITASFSVTIELFDTAGDFDTFEVNRFQAKYSSPEHAAASSVSQETKNVYPKVYPVKSSLGYAMPINSLYDSRIRLCLGKQWLTTIKHEFGHSLTFPIFNTSSSVLQACVTEGLAESLCNNLPLLRYKLLEIAQAFRIARAFETSQILEILTHANIESLNESILYTAGHLLINYWLEYYTSSFVDIMIAIRDDNVDEIRHLLGIFEDKKGKHFAQWMKSLLDPHSLETIYYDKLEGSEFAFNDIVSNIEPVHNFLARYDLTQFDSFKETIGVFHESERNILQFIYNAYSAIENTFESIKEKISPSDPLDKPTDKIVQSIDHAIDNIQVPILRRLFEEYQWITLEQLLMVTPTQRFYFTHFTSYLEHTKAAFPQAKAVLEAEENNCIFTIDALFNYYYDNQCETTSISINTLCQVLSSCIQILADDSICQLILKKEITLKEVIIQRVNQPKQAIAYNTIFAPQIKEDNQSFEDNQSISYDQFIIGRFLTALFHNQASNRHSDPVKEKCASETSNTIKPK